VSTIDPGLIARAGTIAPPGQDSAARIIGRGLETAPILREGLGVTWLFAAVGAAGRVVVPILIQQAIDKGVDEETGDVQFDLILKNENDTLEEIVRQIPVR
jgi:putative ABC transport system ATP-binding protein